jgi:hypothetical protein
LARVDRRETGFALGVERNLGDEESPGARDRLRVNLAAAGDAGADMAMK